MESNGKPGMIQCSQKTADLLVSAGKQAWLTKRDELITAKGKGTLQTYWVEPNIRSDPSASNSSTTDLDAQHVMGSISPNLALIEKFIDWNLDHFILLIKRIIQRRVAMGRENEGTIRVVKADSSTVLPRSEITEVIALPDFDFKLKSDKGKAPSNVELPPAVTYQLHDYISTIAYMYR
jgi:hypothetical protein